MKKIKLSYIPGTPGVEKINVKINDEKTTGLAYIYIYKNYAILHQNNTLTTARNLPTTNKNDTLATSQLIKQLHVI
jgi:hypothetical protein